MAHTSGGREGGIYNEVEVEGKDQKLLGSMFIIMAITEKSGHVRILCICVASYCAVHYTYIA
jgi:hypothetical protein